MAIFIPVDVNAETVHVVPKNGYEFTLEEMRSYVEGHIEAFRLNEMYVMWVNEDGVGLGKEINLKATAIARQHRPKVPSLVIVGNALIASKAETGDE